MMKRLSVLLIVSVLGCANQAGHHYGAPQAPGVRREVRSFDDPFAVDKSIPLYKAPRVAVLYVVNRQKREDGILVGSHYVFVEAGKGRFISDGSEDDTVDIEANTVIKIPPSKKDRELSVRMNWQDAILKRQEEKTK